MRDDANFDHVAEEGIVDLRAEWERGFDLFRVHSCEAVGVFLGAGTSSFLSGGFEVFICMVCAWFGLALRNRSYWY